MAQERSRRAQVERLGIDSQCLTKALNTVNWYGYSKPEVLDQVMWPDLPHSIIFDDRQALWCCACKDCSRRNGVKVQEKLMELSLIHGVARRFRVQEHIVVDKLTADRLCEMLALSILWGRLRQRTQPRDVFIVRDYARHMWSDRPFQEIAQQEEPKSQVPEVEAPRDR